MNAQKASSRLNEAATTLDDPLPVVETEAGTDLWLKQLITYLNVDSSYLVWSLTSESVCVCLGHILCNGNIFFFWGSSGWPF